MEAAQQMVCSVLEQILVPVQLISFTLHCPDCKHVLVTFPLGLPYPFWQPNAQFDPYVLPQDTVRRMAFAGMLKGAQVTAVMSTYKISFNNTSDNDKMIKLWYEWQSCNGKALDLLIEKKKNLLFLLEGML